jgi:hypothetical protein
LVWVLALRPTDYALERDEQPARLAQDELHGLAVEFAAQWEREELLAPSSAIRPPLLQ